MEKIESYKDAVYHVKRGFLIIGLTGYTGSGCTTVSRILKRINEPQIPSCESIFGQSPKIRDQLIYKKLKRFWRNSDFDWEPFVHIEVAKVIFSFAVYRSLKSKINDENLKQIREVVRGKEKALAALKYLIKNKKDYKKKASELIEAYKICDYFYTSFKKIVSSSLGDFIEVMQNYGDEIRKYGQISSYRKKPSPKNLFILPEAIRRLIKAHQEKGSTHFVIDAFRNPYEVEYFKRRYSEFYCVGILRELKDRDEALRLSGISENSLKKIKQREEGKGKNEEEINRTKDNIADWVTSQNINACLQKADVFIKNKNSKTYPNLRFNLIKLITLAKNPGCIPPTDEERCMQVAMTARQMSGCISRQVGAVVVNKDGYGVGIGWNDSPVGLPSCSLRTGKELVDNEDKTIFSDFELSEKFVKHIKNKHYVDKPFCFKRELPSVIKEPEKKMAEFTRALHAEENAIFQALRNTGNDLEGATLYTTDETCTLCAKKAFQLGIKRIVYIDEYPGVAVDQTIKAGKRDIKIDKFEGVIGSAYFRLFTTLLPENELIQLYQ